MKTADSETTDKKNSGSREVDAYLTGLPGAQREALEKLRQENGKNAKK